MDFLHPNTKDAMKKIGLSTMKNESNPSRAINSDNPRIFNGRSEFKDIEENKSKRIAYITDRNHLNALRSSTN